MTKQLDILVALKAMVEAALPAADVRGFDGDTSFPKLIGSGGMVIGFPGDPGEPEICLGPPAYSYDHEIPLQVAAPLGAGGAALDAMIEAIGAAIRADRLLGGLCNYLTATAPLREDRTVDEATLHWAEFSLVATYETDDPLH